MPRRTFVPSGSFLTSTADTAADRRRAADRRQRRAAVQKRIETLGARTTAKAPIEHLIDRTVRCACCGAGLNGCGCAAAGVWCRHCRRCADHCQASAACNRFWRKLAADTEGGSR